MFIVYSFVILVRDHCSGRGILQVIVRIYM